MAARPCFIPTSYALKFVLLILSCCLFHACAYRIATPFQMPQGLAIQISENDARLVHTQTFLRQALAQEIERELNWHIHTESINQLNINIHEEKISESAHDADGISSRWRNTLHVEATLKSPYLVNGSISKNFSSNASNSSLANENNALEKASASMARDVRNWLDSLDFKLPQPKPVP